MQLAGSSTAVDQRLSTTITQPPRTGNKISFKHVDHSIRDPLNEKIAEQLINNYESVIIQSSLNSPRMQAIDAAVAVTAPSKASPTGSSSIPLFRETASSIRHTEEEGGKQRSSMMMTI